MSSFRPRRVIPSAINTPTSVVIKSSKLATQSETERILTAFIDISESVATTVPGQASSSNEILNADSGLSNSTGNAAIISQLKRLQRDLRGLPPTLTEFNLVPELSSNKKIRFDDDSQDQPSNKKIKFELEEPQEVIIQTAMDETVDETINDTANETKDYPSSGEEEETKEETKEKKSKKDKKEKKERKEKKHKKDKTDKKEKKEKTHKHDK
ncbi:hypothetical protein PSN45_004495 [Yamadazyma tenuis]|uniref:RNA polymerase I, subunit RPA14 n=1 Tax=Candida tenuis (strain ATCC 10573 / BCRC 21748 / CBS 615 / JCM 9827 / NBRC 10315 / NRRL Y-1498 / VKM Y-70) TaxID=590646 RepID=G3B5I0_CANTC|nr:RNA polymerase I, subunit RPA14 [Yamadazyma tenuis ATCC 10573]XP_006687380.1 uncharacterized protein CANTEDRAFT_114537 [Yamadazyma tenuis ATCC 10573]EGV63586.1 RNA polymerase I, subunit RPA14 [Yamadazyma tenuis ATCC 10573]EGV63587.1 hypothetical protein CANTEDRAFT_114537 [Yamadazyma tenuis ATCC 10573]WEJ96949.1 hypothetical protein PSN45_004495 [Yamadazyma tenuis]